MSFSVEFEQEMGNRLIKQLFFSFFCFKQSYTNNNLIISLNLRILKKKKQNQWFIYDMQE
jgi:hypothetical protein